MTGWSIAQRVHYMHYRLHKPLTSRRTAAICLLPTLYGWAAGLAVTAPGFEPGPLRYKSLYSKIMPCVINDLLTSVRLERLQIDMVRLSVAVQDLATILNYSLQISHFWGDIQRQDQNDFTISLSYVINSNCITLVPSRYRVTKYFETAEDKKR